MFSGIVEARAKVRAAKMRGNCLRAAIETPRGWKLALGESVNVDGICSTVVARASRRFEVEYMPQTLRNTTAGAFAPNGQVNLERSLVYGARVSGHFVTGHVDARATVLRIEQAGRSKKITIAIPSVLSTYIVPRGSVAVNGVSLTVADVARGRFEVALIPHTLAATNLGSLEKGGAVNIECDMLARYGLKKFDARVARNGAKRIRKET